MMKISRICGVYFSPCGSVKKVVAGMARYAGEKSGIPVEAYDFTLPAQREGRFVFREHDLVFFGTPVYAGRVPNKIMPYIKEGFSGNGAAAAPVVVFGNRNFDDALVELGNLLEDNAFHVIAGSAVTARHSFSHVIAAGRPNEQDFSDIRSFAGQVLAKAEEISEKEKMKPASLPGNNPPEKYYTPLGIDGKPARFLKACPKTDMAKCDGCGICSEKCPMGSVDRGHPETVAGICIKCQACVRGCPKGAKYFDDAAFLSHIQMLEKNYSRPAQSCYIL